MKLRELWGSTVNSRVRVCKGITLEVTPNSNGGLGGDAIQRIIVVAYI
jgi:hypothetical protein